MSTMKRSDSVASEMNEISRDDTGKIKFQTSTRRVARLVNWFDIIFGFYLPYLSTLGVGVVIVQVFRKLLAKNFDFYAFYTNDFHFDNFDYNDIKALGWRSMLVFTAIIYYLTRSVRPVYLMDFTTFKPPDSWNITKEQIVEILEKHNVYSKESIEFQKRMIEQTGPGKSTAWPPAIVQVLDGKKYEPTIENSRKEAETVMFDVVGRLLEQTGVKAKEVDFLIINCSLFSPTPSLTSMVANKFKFRTDVSTYNLSGMGCSAGLISLELAKNLLNGRPNSRAIIVSTEIITPNLYSGNDRGFLLQNLLFRCGGAAILLSNRFQDRFTANFKLLHVVRTQYSDEPKSKISKGDKVNVPHPKPSSEQKTTIAKVVEVHTEGSTPKAYAVEYVDKKLKEAGFTDAVDVPADKVTPYVLDSFGCVYETEDQLGNRGVRLSQDLVSVAGRAMEKNFAMIGPYVLSFREQIKYAWSVFRKNILKVKDAKTYQPDFKSGVDHWCIHAGGRGVIQSVKENLGLDDMDILPSAMALREYGNTSSSSIWYEMDYIRNNFQNCKDQENLEELNFMAGHELKRSQKVFQIGFGSGFKCNSAVWMCINPQVKRYTKSARGEGKDKKV